MRWLRVPWQWFDDRTGTGRLLGEAARHPVPPGTNWWYVFGSATLVAFMIQVASGIGLATVYVPSTGEAYSSLQFISSEAKLGHFLRGMHYFGASAMVLLIGIHILRVFLMAAYKYPREMSWLSGVLLLGVIVAMGFTGQLLRWDQNAVWSIVVAAEQAGRVPWIGRGLASFILAGDTVGGATLTRFFAFHVFFIPSLIFAAIPLHLYLVLRNGISEPPRAGQPVDVKTYRAWYADLLKRQGHPFWPDAAWRDVCFGLAVVVVVVALAIFVGAPQLGKAPDPTIIAASPRPDWYLLWYFAVLALLPPAIEDYVMVGAPLLAGLVLVLLPFLFPAGERHPLRRPWAVGIVLMIVLMVGTLFVEGERAPWSPDFNAQPLRTAALGASQGVLHRGAQVFEKKGCLNCHRMGDSGGYRGPDLTMVGDRLSGAQLISRILNGATNMPAYGRNMDPADLDHLVEFLKSRSTH